MQVDEHADVAARQVDPLAWLTGGGLVRAVVVALVFFVLATAWSWWRFRERLQRDAERR